MNEISFFKLMGLMMLQIVLLVVMHEFISRTFLPLQDELLTISKFIEIFDANLKFNRILFIGAIIVSVALQVLLFRLHKGKDSQKIFGLFMIAFIGLDSYKLYRVLFQIEYYQSEYLLTNNKKEINNLRVRTYMYHYFKIKGDTVGMDYVVKNSLISISADDLSYLVEHRTDKKFESIVNPK